MKKLIVILLVLSFVCVGINVFAQTLKIDDTISSTTFNLTTSTKEVKFLFANPTCLSNAINARETSIISALTTKNNAILEALQLRKEALGQTIYASSRQDLKKRINTAKNTFNQRRNVLIKDYKKQVQSAWDTFKTAKKACNANLYNESNSDFNL